MCRVLKVGKAGFYAWANREPKEISLGRFDEIVAGIFKSHSERAGSRKICRDLLEKHGIKRSARTVRRSLARQNLRCIQARKHRVTTTDSNHNLRIAPNRLERNFKTDKPNRVWVSDITYIRVGTFWFYLCVIIDLYHRKVVGWCFADNMRTEILLEAYRQACRRERPGPGLIFHSDRGSQYASRAFRQALINNRHLRSMSRKGDCWDNAVAESFFRTLKVELVYTAFFLDEEDARIKIFEYIDLYYNKIRRHQTLSYLSPENYLKKHSG